MPGAPDTVYTTKKLPVHIAGVIKLDSYLALKLAAYGANIKSLFYLDLLLVIKNDAGGVVGFLGAIEENANSYNFKHHSSSRFFKAVLRGADGKKYRILNDGGLNTTGDSNTPVVNVTEAGKCGVSLQMFKSAYYVSTDRYGISIRLNDETPTWVDFELGQSIAQQASVISDYLIEMGLTEFGDSVSVKGWIENAEGRYESNPTTYITTAVPVDMSYSSTSSGGACSMGNVSTYWVKLQSFTVGDTIYTNSACSNAAPTGWYSVGGAWYYQNSNGGGKDAGITPLSISASGSCSGGGVTYTERTWQGYTSTGSSSLGVCNLMDRGGATTVKTYVGINDGKHYTSSALTTLANGWYGEIIGGVHYWSRIQNGVITSTGQC